MNPKFSIGDRVRIKNDKRIHKVKNVRTISDTKSDFSVITYEFDAVKYNVVEDDLELFSKGENI